MTGLRAILKTLVLIVAVFLLSACGGGGGGGDLPDGQAGGHGSPPTQPVSPAATTYTAQLVAEHQPGFFSCANFNGQILLGTYQDYTNLMRCQLCELVGNRVKVLHTFDGESVYHIRVFDNYAILPIEQGSLYRYDAGDVCLLKNKRYHMGFYDFVWLGGHNYSLEKENVYPPNRVAIYQDLHDWFESADWKAKDMIAFDGKLYCSASGLNNRTEAAIVEIDPNTKAVKLYKSFRWCWPGTLTVYDGAVWMSMDCDGTITNTLGEEFHLGNHAWFIGKVGNTFFATTGGRWRGVGLSHLWVFDPETRQFIKKLDFPDAEPWFICQAGENSFYLVTRNEEENNLGRVYLIERK